MLEALQNLFPDQIDPYASLIVGAFVALLILTVGWIASKWARAVLFRSLRSRKVDEALIGFLGSILQYTILAAAVIAALGKVGIESTSLVAIFGAAGLAVGFALQGSLSNFASGVLMLLFRPIDIGDRVMIAGCTGAVKEIGLFATRVETPDAETIIIPNARITDDNIVNFSKLGHCRANIAIGVAYGTDLTYAMKVIEAACSESELVLPEPAPSVGFAGFGSSSIDLVARPWSKPDDFPGMQHNVRLSIYRALTNAGITIPFDQIVVHQAN